MIEITAIDSGKKVHFVKGATVKEDVDKNLVKEIIDIDQEINNDLQELKAIEKAASDDDTSCGACTTAIGKPITYTVQKTRQKVFDSGLKVYNLHKDKVKVEIPKIILSICDEIQERVGHNEFSIVCKGKWGNDGEYIISDEYVVPKQKVDGAAVDYDFEHLEQLKIDGFNAVIHSHPFKSSAFSSSDEETINSHFDCSILYSLREFTTATVLISQMSGAKLLADGKPHVEGVNIVPEAFIDNIEKRTAYNYGGAKIYDFDNRGDFGNFHGAGRDNFRGTRNEVNRDFPTRGPNSQVTRFGKSEYTYDPVNDIFYKNGVAVDAGARTRAAQKCQGHGCGVQDKDPMTKIHGNCSCTQLPNRVFTTDQTKVFHIDDKQSKKKGGKRDNQPKIDMP